MGERDASSAEFLREAMVRRLTDGQSDARFDFMVQPAPDSDPKWIDDPTLEWADEVSPLTKVATITIAPQQFDTDRLQEVLREPFVHAVAQLARPPAIGPDQPDPPRRVSSQFQAASSNNGRF